MNVYAQLLIGAIVLLLLSFLGGYGREISQFWHKAPIRQRADIMWICIGVFILLMLAASDLLF
jgi:hypothetical protein